MPSCRAGQGDNPSPPPSAGTCGAGRTEPLDQTNIASDPRCCSWPKPARRPSRANPGTERPLRDLATATGETAHATVLSGTTLYGLAACESPRHATRAIIDLDRFPLHATASGLCALAFGPTGLMDTALSDFTQFTETTAATPDALRAAVAAAHTTGFGRADRSYETEIHRASRPHSSTTLVNAPEPYPWPVSPHGSRPH